MKSFMRQEQIALDIEKFNQTLDTHVVKFQACDFIRRCYAILLTFTLASVDRHYARGQP